jgi:hypothetical protein
MSESYTKSPVTVDPIGGYLFARSVGSACLEETEFMFAQIRGFGHLKYLGEARAQEIQDANLERLAVAWNAVQGIPTEEIQPMAEENKRLRSALESIARQDANHFPAGECPGCAEAVRIARTALKGV